MKKIFKKLFGSVKGAIDITGVVIDIVLVVALIPVITAFISAKSYGCFDTDYPNLITGSTICTNGTTNVSATLTSASTTEVALLGLTALFIVLALVFMIVKQSGLTKKF